MKKLLILFFITILLAACHPPVQESYRWRVPTQNVPGENFKIQVPPVDSAEIFLPAKFVNSDSFIILIHFHGASYIGKYATSHAVKPAVLANIDIGQGSSTYEKPFFGKNKFPAMLAAIKKGISARLGRSLVFKQVIISSFSAGYGAVRTILRSPENIGLIDGIILLDGMHTDYSDTNLVFPQNLNTDKLDMYLAFANEAISGKKVMIITHSAIYPGAYASNRETTDYLLRKLAIGRIAKDKFLSTGMHQTSEAGEGNFFVFGFDGQTARDHVDHFHALPYWFDFAIKILTQNN